MLMTFKIEKDKKAQKKAPDKKTKRTKGIENYNKKATTSIEVTLLNGVPKNWDSGHTL